MPPSTRVHLSWRHLGAFVAMLAAAALTLSAFGRPWWCRVGDARPWAGDIWSRHNSQHLVDPYTVTHVLHGVAMYGILRLLLGRVVGPFGRLAFGLAIEVAWELIENTDAMIERYRATTISLDYYGDSVANSLGDVLGFTLGYLGATVVPAWASVAGFLLIDAVLLLCIRDSLLLNLLMLIHPLAAVKTWQLAGRAA